MLRPLGGQAINLGGGGRKLVGLGKPSGSAETWPPRRNEEERACTSKQTWQSHAQPGGELRTGRSLCRWSPSLGRSSWAPVLLPCCPVPGRGLPRFKAAPRQWASFPSRSCWALPAGGLSVSLQAPWGCGVAARTKPWCQNWMVPVWERSRGQWMEQGAKPNIGKWEWLDEKV